MKFLNQFIMYLCLLISFSSFSQTSVNEYKYVYVPDNYSFLKGNDQYQLNSLTVFLFEKNNFTVLNSLKNYPSDLATNSCLLLKSDLIKIKGFFKTKLQLVLTDCRDNIVFSSEIGQSKLKDFKKSFQEALRNTFVSVTELNYGYSGSITSPKPPLTSVVEKGIIEGKTPNTPAPLAQSRKLLLRQNLLLHPKSLILIIKKLCWGLLLNQLFLDMILLIISPKKSCIQYRLLCLKMST